MIVLYNLFVIKVVLLYLLGWKFLHINLEVSYPLFVFSKGSRNKITCLETVAAEVYHAHLMVFHYTLVHENVKKTPVGVRTLF